MFISNYTSHTNKISTMWESLFFPLANKFYTPKEMIFFHEIMDLEGLLNHSDNYFFKDGVLGLFPMLKLCHTHSHLNFRLNISAHLAPLVPSSYQRFFNFYSLSSVNSLEIKNIDTLIVYLSKVPNFHDDNKFIFDLQKLPKTIRKIHIFKSPIQEISFAHVMNKEYETKTWDKMILELQKLFSTAETVFEPPLASIEQFNLENCYYLNTNHFSQFFSVDFFAYYFFFYTGFYPQDALDDLYLKKINTSRIVKDLAIDFYQYEGDRIYEKEILAKLASLYFPVITEDIKPNEFYSYDLINFSEKLALGLFKFQKTKDKSSLPIV